MQGVLQGPAVTLESIYINSSSSSRDVEYVETCKKTYQIGALAVDTFCKPVGRIYRVLHTIHSPDNYAQSAPGCQHAISVVSTVCPDRTSYSACRALLYSLISHSSASSVSIFSLTLLKPCRMVLWSRPPKNLPTLARELSVNSRARYMAIWRGQTIS